MNLQIEFRFLVHFTQDTSGENIYFAHTKKIYFDKNILSQI